MKFFFKRVILFLLAVAPLIFYPGRALLAPQIIPAMTVSLPSSIEVQLGETFSIPVTITNDFTSSFTVDSVTVSPEPVNITMESRAINQNLFPNRSMRVNLLVRARSPGVERVGVVVTAVYSGTLLPAVSEVLVIVSAPALPAVRPNFIIPGVTFVPEKPDLAAPFTLNVALQNTGTAVASDLVVTFDGGKNFVVTTLSNRVQLSSVAQGASASASFQIRARERRESNEITLTLSSGAYTQTEILNLPLPARQHPPNPLPVISSFTLKPAQGGQFMLNLIVQNSGGTEAKDLRVALDGGDKVFPPLAGKTRSITALSPGEVATVEYLLSSRGELSHHPLNISFDFFDPTGNELKSSERIFISSDLEPSLKIAGFNAQPKDDEGKFLFNLQLQNKGHSLARDISIRFTGTQAFPLEGSNLVSVANLAAGATTQLSVMMKAGTESEIYSLPVEIGYRSVGGAEHKTSETIVLTAASIGVDVPGQKQSTPRVMLKRHALSTNQVLAGGTFTLTLHIKNNAARAVGNMKISLGNIQVGGGAAGGAGGAGAAGAGGTVFSTLDGSSSSFFVESITANGWMIKEIALFVDPNATAMTYSLPITIEYEDAEGKAFSVSEAVNIPVLQESGIRVLALNIPSVAVLGQPVPLSMEFANTGRVALSNLLVVIEGDFPKENATYFIPRLDIGVSDFFQGMIIPATKGAISGNLVITFLDSRHQEVRIDHPFTMEVQAMQELPMEIPEAEPPIAGGFPAIFRIVLGIGGSAFLLVSLFLLKRKMAKRRQAFFEEKI